VSPKRPPGRTCVSVRRAVYDRLRAYCEGLRIVDGKGGPLLIGPEVDRIITAALDAEEERIAKSCAKLATAVLDQLHLPLDDHPPGTCPCGRCPRN
jgi:hypothetical protein